MSGPASGSEASTRRRTSSGRSLSPIPDPGKEIVMTQKVIRLVGLLAAAAVMPACGELPVVTPVKDPGQGVSWCRANNQVASYTLGAEGYFRIRLMNPDGSG